MADYSYMTTPKVKAQPNTSTLREVGGQQRTMTYDQPTTNQSIAKLPPAQNISAPRQSGGGNWSLPTFNPNTNQGNTYSTQGTQATPGGGSQNYWDRVDPWNTNFSDSADVNQTNSLLPVAQFDQNNYQYANDFNEAKNRWNAEFGLTQNQNTFQQGLSTRQQMSAEEQARIAASQWNQQFGHTQNMDMLGYGLSQQGLNNQYAQGMDQNQASRDVASTYANSNRYQAQQQLTGQQYQADRQLAGQLGSAGIYAGAQNYGAQLGLQGQLGSAGMYSDAQRYQAQQQYAGQMGSAGLYSNAQIYGTDAQERMNAAMMANNLAVANTQAYGRSQAPNVQWARGWG